MAIREACRSEIIGHMPREISRAVLFFLKADGHVTGQVTNARRTRSPIEQGGMKILATFTATHCDERYIRRLKDIITVNLAHYKQDKSDSAIEVKPKAILPVPEVVVLSDSEAEL